MLYRYRAQAVGAFTMPLISVLTFIAIIIRQGLTASRQPQELKATWLFPVHTTLLLFAYAAFFVVFMASVMYLLQERELKLKTFSGIFHRLPSLSTVNELATTAAALGLTLLTVGIATGMLWSSTRDGKIWHQRPEGDFCRPDLAALLAADHLSLKCAVARAQSSVAGCCWFCPVLCTFFGTRLLGVSRIWLINLS